MTDPKDRNGYPFTVPQVIEHRRPEPIATKPLASIVGAVGTQARIVDTLLQLVHASNYQSEQLAENTAQLISLTAAHNRMADVVKSHDAEIRSTQESVPDTEEIREVVEVVKNEDKAEELDEIKKSRRAIRNGVAIAVIAAAIISVATFLLGRASVPTSAPVSIPAAH